MRSTSIIQKKSQTIEALLATSSLLLQSLLKSEYEQVERFLADRHLLFQDLQSCDSALGNTPTDADADWSLKLKQIQKVDQKIEDFLQQHKAAIQREFQHLANTKKTLLDERQIDPRGQKLEVKG